MMKTSALTLLLLAGAAFAQPTFQPAIQLPVGSQPDGLAFLDVDRNGLQDIAVVVDQPDRLQFVMQAVGGAFTLGASLALPGGSSPQDVESADFDRDGDLDLVVALANSNQVIAIRNLGPNSFQVISTISVGTEPREIALIDFDRDGDLDLAVSARTSNDVTIVRNDVGLLTVQTVIPVGNDPRDLAAGDINNDGFADIAVAVADDRRVVVLRGSATGFTSAAQLAMPFNEKPSGVALGDFDLDGDLDIAATGGNAPNMLVLFDHVANLTFAAGRTTLLPLEPGTAFAADFDRDGLLDLALAVDTGTQVMVLENLGGGTFGAPQLLAAGLHPDAIRTGDLDGDGDSDLVTSNRDSGSVTIYVNSNTFVPANPLSITLMTPAAINTTAMIRLSAPGEAGRTFVTAWSSASTPGIILPDGRTLPLAFDFVFLLSLQANNGLFTPIAGVLDASGNATAQFIVPNQPLLRGLQIWTAFLTGDNMGTIFSISPALRVTVQ